MTKKNKWLWPGVACFALFVVFFWVAGKLLDLEAERVVDQLYLHDAQGIISGLEPVAIVEDKPRALVLIHGYLDSPETFLKIAHDIQNKAGADIYIPLLPYHGRNLQVAAQFNNAVILNNIETQLQTLAKKYASVTVLGMSYGGTLLVDLARRNALPSNVHLVLEAPAIFIQGNTFLGRAKARVYGVWRNYCNYPALGCNFPAYGSADNTARVTIAEAKSLQYDVISAANELYQLDLANRDYFQHIKRPYVLINAVDDNRIDYAKQKAICLEDAPYCHFYSFASGKHMLLLGANQQAFENLLVRLVNNNSH